MAAFITVADLTRHVSEFRATLICKSTGRARQKLADVKCNSGKFSLIATAYIQDNLFSYYNLPNEIVPVYL